MSDPQHTPSPPPAPRRWLVPALALSLALNLGVIGLAAGAWLGGPRGMHGEGGDGGFRTLVQAMPEGVRRDLGRDLWSHRADFRDGRAAMDKLRHDLAAALTAEPFDIAEVNAAFDGQRAALLAVANRGFEALMARIAAMDAAERASFAENLMAARPR